jgi:hypothetical protein
MFRHCCRWRLIETYRDYAIYQYDDRDRYEARRKGRPMIEGCDLPDLKADIDESYR